jgi:hypothetical protein
LAAACEWWLRGYSCAGSSSPRHLADIL